jgi:hypothetical protein
MAFLLLVGSVWTAIAARGHPRLQGAGFVAALAVVALFTPNVSSRRRWWW